MPRTHSTSSATNVHREKKQCRCSAFAAAQPSVMPHASGASSSTNPANEAPVAPRDIR